ncbi:hypothetical protein M9H77_05586 [Catharanthus roseus]|uniref:Uncharacterized protein n=1 Tax=Catharanthus roseus TaxID=4058 RepID=A0ACC0CHX0_CATRO|nr:hypothetical protein M9H77_05586 [Catharanthus roseus]
MARNLSTKLPFHGVLAFSIPPWLTLFIAVFIAILSIFSIVAFLCGSHHDHQETKSSSRRRTERLGDQRAIARLQSNISSKALLLSKMISWKKVQDQEHEDHYDDEAIWKKKIIQGEKCRPLNFSGKILYDSEGNRLPDSPS